MSLHAVRQTDRQTENSGAKERWVIMSLGGDRGRLDTSYLS